jgi:hypothetical protein
MNFFFSNMFISSFQGILYQVHSSQERQDLYPMFMFCLGVRSSWAFPQFYVVHFSSYLPQTKLDLSGLYRVGSFYVRVDAP